MNTNVEEVHKLVLELNAQSRFQTENRFAPSFYMSQCAIALYRYLHNVAS
jgi:hypothetical protein